MHSLRKQAPSLRMQRRSGGRSLDLLRRTIGGGDGSESVPSARAARERYTDLPLRWGSAWPRRHDQQLRGSRTELLTGDGAVVKGSLYAPPAQELEHLAALGYQGDAGYPSSTARTALVAFTRRGRDIVSIRGSLCGPDSAHFAILLGGAKNHDPVHFTLDAKLPSAHTRSGGQPARHLVWMQGRRASFSMPEIRSDTQNVLARAIAWARQHPVDDLVDYKPPPMAPPALS